MTSKYLFILLLLCPIFLSGQESHSLEKVYYSVEDSLPIFRISTFEKKKPDVFYYLNGKEKKVNYNIKYKGGHEALTHYFDSIYLNRPDYNNKELNGMFFYSILFDKNLNIKEVNILERHAYDNDKYDYDTLIRKILQSTDGKWIKNKEKENNEWYFYYGLMKLK